MTITTRLTMDLTSLIGSIISKMEAMNNRWLTLEEPFRWLEELMVLTKKNVKYLIY